MGRNEPMKASDVFRKTNHVFVGKARFDKVFPQIEDIKVTVQELGKGVIGDGVLVYKKNQFGEYIDCSNPRCYNGGFSIGSIVREMVKDKKVEFNTSRNCKSYEGSPKGRKRYGPCDNTFTINVKIKYKENLSDNTTP
jgi:hypothetical protein